MKNIFKTIVLVALALAAVGLSFRTENLTERNHREQLAAYKPSEYVEAMFRDSLSILEGRAITIEALASGLRDSAFVAQHSRVLGIGSPLLFVVKGEMEAPVLVADELRNTVHDVEIAMPVKYIFGNTARDASGWFCIDDFKNTPDFNAVSAEMNKYIRNNVIGSNATAFSQQEKVEFVGAVAIAVDEKHLSTLTVIPYILR